MVAFSWQIVAMAIYHQLTWQFYNLQFLPFRFSNIICHGITQAQMLFRLSWFIGLRLCPPMAEALTLLGLWQFLGLNFILFMDFFFA